MITADPNLPTSKLSAILFLRSGAEKLRTHAYDYHDRKAAQLLDLQADLLICEMAVESWTADLGTAGCAI